jgi:hypothetical protein
MKTITKIDIAIVAAVMLVIFFWGFIIAGVIYVIAKIWGLQ